MVCDISWLLQLPRSPGDWWAMWRGRPSILRYQQLEFLQRFLPLLCLQKVIVLIPKKDQSLMADDAVIQDGHLSCSPLQGLYINHGALIGGGQLVLVLDRGQRLARHGVLISRAGVLRGDIDGYSLSVFLWWLWLRCLFKIADHHDTDVIVYVDTSSYADNTV